MAAWSHPQGGVLSRRQLLRRGVPSTTIERFVARGDLWRVHPGVYAVGRPDLGEYGRAWAGILATRGRKDRPNVRALSHRTAIAVLGLAPFPRSPEIVVVGLDLAIEGLVVRRTRRLTASDVDLDRNRLPSTTWTRTLVDVASVAAVADLEEYLRHSWQRRRRPDFAALDAALRAAHGRSGTRRLRHALEPYLGLDEEDYRSLLERLAHRLLRSAGITGIEVNAPVELLDGRVIHVDLLLRDHGLGIEVDGRDPHARAREFQWDRYRDRELKKLGIDILRFTWWDVTRSPAVVVRDTCAVLGLDQVRR